MRAKVVSLLVLAAACGDNERHIVQVDLSLGTADVIAYRTDVSSWRAPELVGDGSYELEVVEDFELVAVFRFDDGSFWAEELAATYSDGSHWMIYSNSELGALVVGKTGPASAFEDTDACWPFPRSGTVPVAGRMFQAGQVAMGRSCKGSARAPWNFSLDVPTGTHDLIATDSFESNNPRISIERQQRVDSATAVPDIDLAFGGVALASTQVVVMNTDDSGDVETDVTLFTSTDFARVSKKTSTVSAMQVAPAYVVPSSVLEATDDQALEVHSPGAGAIVERSARTFVTGSPTVIELIQPPAITYDVGSVVDTIRWDGELAPRYGYVDFNVESWAASGLDSAQHVTATKRWLEAHQASQLGFDTSAPGYLATWAIDRTQRYGRFVGIRDDSTDITYMTKVFTDSSGSAGVDALAPMPTRRDRLDFAAGRPARSIERPGVR